MRKLVTWTAVIAIVVQLLAPQGASAASSFDSSIRTTTDTTLRCVDTYSGVETGEEIDAINWSELLVPSNSTWNGKPINRGALGGSVQAIYDRQQANLARGAGWGTAFVDSDNAGRTMTLSIAKTDSPFEFKNYANMGAGWNVLYHSNAYQMTIQCRNNDVVLTNYSDGESILYRDGSSASTVWFLADDIVYPPGYEGVIIPETGTVEESALVQPNFVVDVADRNVKVEFRDVDYEDDFVYAWTMLKMTDSELIADGTVFDSGVNEPGDKIDFTVDKRQKYVFGVQMCAVGTLETDETCVAMDGTKAIWITLDINGSPIHIDTEDDINDSATAGECLTDTLNGVEITHCTQRSLMSDCMVDGFPFINITGCLSNIGMIGRLLSFNILPVDLAGRLDATPCKTLSVLDDWMNLENATVCPMVPEYVRNVVTPFVTSAVGLMGIAFLTRSSRERF